MTQKEPAWKLGVDLTILGDFEREERIPAGEMEEKIKGFPVSMNSS
jgi:hypothetical protein